MYDDMQNQCDAEQCRFGATFMVLKAGTEQARTCHTHLVRALDSMRADVHEVHRINRR